MFDLSTLDLFPDSPGVYLMKDEEKAVLYVGKAKNLRSRVRQYFSKGGDSRPQIPYLIARVHTIDTLVVTSEKEALLLENTLIKQHRPPYNIFLKDDKSYMSLKITTQHPWPMIELVRYKGSPPSDGLYFGPYTSSYSAKQTLELLIRLFPLRRCSDRELALRKRPCILHGIKRCVAPCANLCTQEEYQQIVKRVIKFLRGEDKEILKELYAQMESLSQALQFEKAQEILQMIHHLEGTVEEQHVDQAGLGDKDVIGLYREAGEVSISQLMFREGKLVGAENFHFSSIAQEDGDLLHTFLLQLYQKQEGNLPHEILLPSPIEGQELLCELFSTQSSRKIQIHHPLRGDKRTLVTMAQTNAQAAFMRGQDLQTLKEKRLLDLQERLSLNNYPRRIECFDTSHLQGTDFVSVMVAFLDGEKDRSGYRKFKVRSVQAGDDYGALREVLLRRYTKGKEEDNLPDLVMIDGGKAHLNIALQVIQELNIVTMDVISLSKEAGRHDRGMTLDQVHLSSTSTPISLPARSPTLFFLQQIRDEAHRFAITFHRKRREKRLVQSVLDTLPGIGPIKKRRLLLHFGSPKRILAATKEELAQVKGITQRDIATILELSKSQ